jgi:hypothetical protein
MHAPVLQYLLNGADLMLPGVLLPPEAPAPIPTVVMDSKVAVVLDRSS